MPHNCCVPKCFSNSKKNKHLKFHRFPKKKELKEKWIWKIRRDEGDAFVINDNTRICSKHFTEEDYTVSELGKGQKLVLKKSSVPTLFIWTKPTNFRKTRSSVEGWRSEAPSSKKRRKCCLKCEEKSTIDSLDSKLSSQKNSIKDLQDTIVKLEKKVESLESERDDLQLQLSEKNSHVCLGAELFKDDDKSIRYYTGISNWKIFSQHFEFLNERITHLNYWRSVELAKKCFSYQISENENRQGRPRSLKVIDEFFLTLVRVRQGFTLKHLSFLFDISEQTVSRAFLTWINFVYFELGAFPIWQSRDLNNETMPEEFKEKFSNTRCILDCTEIKISKPSSLLAQSQCFSSYKNTNTAKGLLGIAPSGAPVFISELYSSSISDKDITKQSGVLDLFEKGDGCMADKGFDIKDLLTPLEVDLNIPPFLRNKEQFDESEVDETQSIASVRIHVERAINRIKIYKIISNVVPITLADVLNQIWTVCCMLTLFQSPIINQDGDDDDDD